MVSVFEAFFVHDVRQLDTVHTKSRSIKRFSSTVDLLCRGEPVNLALYAGVQQLPAHAPPLHECHYAANRLFKENLDRSRV